MAIQFVPLKREPRPPGDVTCGLVTYRNARRIFEIVTWIGQETYELKADPILLSAKAFTDLIFHLHRKSWMSGQHFTDLLTCLAEVIYRDWEQWPQAAFEVIGCMQADPDRRPPAGLVIPSDKVEAIVRPPVVDPSTLAPPSSEEEDLASLRAFLLAAAAEAESIDDSLPDDMAENHDHYAHGSPRR